MGTVNQITIQGVVDGERPPFTKQIGTGTVLHDFSLTVQPIRAKHQPYTIPCSCFDDIARHAAQFQPGDAVVVTGQLFRDEWTAHTGKRKYSFKIMVSEVTAVEAAPNNSFQNY